MPELVTIVGALALSSIRKYLLASAIHYLASVVKLAKSSLAAVAFLWPEGVRSKPLVLLEALDVLVNNYVDYILPGVPVAVSDLRLVNIASVANV